MNHAARLQGCAAALALPGMQALERGHPDIPMRPANPVKSPQRQTATKRAKLRYRHRRGRWRIGRRCGCLPGAWVETGHAALPGPEEITDVAVCLTGPNAAKIRFPGRGRLPRVHRGRSTRSPRPRQAATPPRRSAQRGRASPSRSDRKRTALACSALPAGAAHGLRHVPQAAQHARAALRRSSRRLRLLALLGDSFSGSLDRFGIA